MNSDNFAVSGETIDYGPFGFLDSYTPDFVPNTSDDEAMYSFAKQPKVAGQNLMYFAKALEPLVGDTELGLFRYWAEFKQRHLSLFGKKLGIRKPSAEVILIGAGYALNTVLQDRNLIQELLDIMAETKADFTMSFYDLRLLVDPDQDAPGWGLEALRASNHY